MQRTEWGTDGGRIDQSRAEAPDDGWEIGHWLTFEVETNRLLNLNLYSDTRVGGGDKSYSWGDRLSSAPSGDGIRNTPDLRAAVPVARIRFSASWSPCKRRSAGMSRRIPIFRSYRMYLVGDRSGPSHSQSKDLRGYYL